MTVKLIPLPWDSEFLGYPVGRITAGIGASKHLAEVITQARKSGYRLLYVLVQPTDGLSQQELQRQDALLADRKVTYFQAVEPVLEEKAEPAIVAAHRMSAQLGALALQSGTYSRFRRDPGFGSQVYEQLYLKWMENSLAGELARTVLVYRPAGQELGVLTLGIKQGRADIGLLAVDEAARGSQIGQRLVAAARQRAHDWGLNTLQVVTQLDNTLACRFYEKCGFRQEQLEYVYHLWLS